jgi:hypothetical protein
MLSCSLPGVGSEAPTATPTSASATETQSAIVENTATNIPTETPIPPTSTPPITPKITLMKNSNCRKGPNALYNIVDQIVQSQMLTVIGRNEQNTWWQVLTASGRECWIFYENASPNTDFSGLPIGSAPPLPNTPVDFTVSNQVCQPNQTKFEVTMRWSGGGGETAFRIYRDGKRLIEVKASKLNFKDLNAPLNKNLTYEIEAVNEHGTSARAAQIVPACK